MKVFIVLASLVVAVAASGTKTHLAGAPLLLAAPVGLAHTGTSSQFRSQDNYGNYNFGYDETHSSGGSSRREEQVNGVRRGSYSLNDADGRRRIVYYVADADGFRATIDSNEPGVEPKDPANVLINKNLAAQPIALAPAPVAPVLAAPHPLPFAAAPLPAPFAAAPLPAPILSAPLQQPSFLPAQPAAPVLAAPAINGLSAAQPLLRSSFGPIAPAAPVAGPVFAQFAQEPISLSQEQVAIVESAAPKAFSYSFGASHPTIKLAAPLPLAQEPVFQQKLDY